MSLDNTDYFPEVDSLEEEKLLIFQTRFSVGPSQHRSVPVAHLDFLNSVLNKGKRTASYSESREAPFLMSYLR